MSSFTMIIHQIWSCHVTLDANLEKFLFFAKFKLIFMKSYQILGKLAQQQKKLQAEIKTRGAYRVK